MEWNGVWQKQATASPSASHVIEYEPENVHDSVLDAMISHAYEMFR